MILYNTTFCIDNCLFDAFMTFLREKYIPAAESCGIHSALILSMRGGGDSDNNTRTLALQMRAPSEAALETFKSKELPVLFNTIARCWGTGIAFFESTLDILHHGGK